MILYALGNQKIHVTLLIAILTLLQWSGTEHPISPRYACIFIMIISIPTHSHPHTSIYTHTHTHILITVTTVEKQRFYFNM